MRARRVGLGFIVVSAGCILEPNPKFDGPGSGGVEGSGSASEDQPVGCEGDTFAFAILSDNDEGQDVSLSRAFEEISARTDVQLIFGAGDIAPLDRLRDAADASPWDGRCGTDAPPVFPAFGHAELADSVDVAWWAEAWASGWVEAAETSPLATQLPGVARFVRGPVSIQTDSGFTPTPDGTMYAFDYRDARFTVVNAHLHEGGDAQAGVWDETGASVNEPAASQLDWVASDAEASNQPLRFVIGHVALVAPCYNTEPPDENYACPGPPPPGWSEHNSEFVTESLTAELALHATTAYFHGHDEVPSRLLLDAERNVLFERKYWDVANDPNGATGDPSSWQGLLAPGRIWQIDSGGVDDAAGGYTIVVVAPDRVTFEIWRYTGIEPTTLWDTWSIPRP